MKQSIKHVRDCYGCGACALACAKSIIDLKLNKQGFYQPYIADETACIKCGLCNDVCPYSNDNIATNNPVISSRAMWSNNPDVRNQSSSGGVGFELAKIAIYKGYKACVVKYDIETNRAEHYISESVSTLKQSLGSKYIQSYTIGAFNEISRKDKYIIFGTPCQIDGLRRFSKRFKCEENFILVDFFCHGVPSMKMWEKYVQHIESKIGPASHLSWRNKTIGWQQSWVMTAENPENGKYSCSRRDGDMFYQFFLGNSCLNKACYKKCKYKYTSSSADIRIGDMWGAEYENNQEGVSAVLAFTNMGLEFLDTVDCTSIEHPVSTVCEGQMKKCVEKPFPEYYIVNSLLQFDSISIHTMSSIMNSLPMKCVYALKARTKRK